MSARAYELACKEARVRGLGPVSRDEDGRWCAVNYHSGWVRPLSLTNLWMLKTTPEQREAA